jgi:hypothetical protein
MIETFIARAVAVFVLAQMLAGVIAFTFLIWRLTLRLIQRAIGGY